LGFICATHLIFVIGPENETVCKHEVWRRFSNCAKFGLCVNLLNGAEQLPEGCEPIYFIRRRYRLVSALVHKSAPHFSGRFRKSKMWGKAIAAPH
jgi:hypothetical protein